MQFITQRKRPAKKCRKVKYAIKLTALLLTCSALACLLPAPRLLQAEASAISNLQDQYDNLEQKQNKIRQELQDIANNKADAQKQAQYVKEQISNTQQQIDILNSKIDLFNQSIAQKEQEMTQKEQEISNYYENFKKRLRAMYVTDTGSMVELLLGSEDFSDFLTRTEYIKNTAAHDKKLLATLREDKRIIEDAKKDIQASKEELITAKTTVDAKQNALETQLVDKNNVVASLHQSEEEKKAEQKKNTDALNLLNAEIEEMIRQSQSQDDYVGGDFLWPVPGYSGITSYYGWRIISGIRDFHTGIDISGGNIYGKNIVAANDGVVSYVKDLGSRGYGKHLMIDHGGGTYTLYAHTSAILVSPGQTVKRSQVIARVGSTGWSTGPHLHYEIWINKQRVNPLPYYR